MEYRICVYVSTFSWGTNSGKWSGSGYMGFRASHSVPRCWVLALLLLSLVFQRASLTVWSTRCWHPSGLGLHMCKVCGPQHTPGPCRAAPWMWVARCSSLQLIPDPGTPWPGIAENGRASWGLPLPPTTPLTVVWSSAGLSLLTKHTRWIHLLEAIEISSFRAQLKHPFLWNLPWPPRLGHCIRSVKVPVGNRWYI